MKEIFKKAENYILKNATPLQKACCNYVSGKGDKQQIICELRKYQNRDGGWANGLEAEYQGPVSTPFTTSVALGHIYRFDLQDTELLENTLKYLKNVQYEDGRWDDTEEIMEYPHPPYMGPGIYPEFKTGMILKWLLRLNVDEDEMMDKAKTYLINVFDEVSRKNDFWSAVSYSGVFSLLPGIPEYSKIMEWSTKILIPENGEIGWQQIMGMIEDEVPVPDRNLSEAVQMIIWHQEQDGGWPHQFGTYNRVWSAIFIIRFLMLKNLI